MVPGYGFQTCLTVSLIFQPYQQLASWKNKPSKFDLSSSVNRNIPEVIYKMDDNLIRVQIKEINLASDFLSLQVIFYTNDN